MITAAKINQIGDSLYLPTTDAKYPGSLAQKFNAILADSKVKEISITIESAGIEMENDYTLELPNALFPTDPDRTYQLDDRTLNLVFTSPFKKTNGKVLTIMDKKNLDNLNITLPSGDFGKLHVYTEFSTTKVVSAGATTVEFSANVYNGKQLTLGSGLNVKVLDTTEAGTNGLVVANGANIAALITTRGLNDANYNWNAGRTDVDTPVYNQKKDNGHIRVNEIIARGTVTISGDINDWTKSAPLAKVTIENNANATLNALASEVVGELTTNADGTTSVTAKLTSNTDALQKTKKVSNVIVLKEGSSSTLTINSEFTNSIFGTATAGFSTYVFNKDINSVQNVEFAKKDSYIKFVVPAQADTDSYTFTWKNVNFAEGSTLNVNEYNNTFNVKGTDGKEIEVTWYYWVNLDVRYPLTDSYLYGNFKTQEEAIKYIEANKNSSILVTYNNNTLAYYRYVLDEAPVQNEDGKWDVTCKDEPLAVKKSLVFTDVPVDYRRYNYNYWYVKEKTTSAVDYVNFTVIFALDNCKYKGEKITSQSLNINAPLKAKDENGNRTIDVNVRYCIDGTYYKPLKGKDTGNWFLTDKLGD